MLIRTKFIEADKMKKLSIGIDIGGTNTKIGVVTQDGKILERAYFSTQGCFTSGEFMDMLIKKVKGIIGKVSSRYDVLGIGVGAPGANRHNGTVSGAANLPWKENMNIQENLMATFGLPCIVTNDANLAAVGEQVFGGAKGLQNFVSITLGTGLGCGVVVGGLLLHGANDLFGELGHTFVPPGDRLCRCGRMGCLETYVSATGLKTTYKQLMGKAGKKDGDDNNTTSNDIANLALKGDHIALEAFRITGSIFGKKLSDAVATYDPSVIFLTGGLSKAGHLLFKPTLNALDKNLLVNFRNRISLLPSALKEGDVSILGGGALIFNYQEPGKSFLTLPGPYTNHFVIS